MKEVINIFKRHKPTVENYIKNLIKNLPLDKVINSQEVFNEHPYIQLVYTVNSEFRQTSPIMCKKNSDESKLYTDKSHYFTKLVLDEDNIYVSNPYIHYRTGKASISVVRYVDEQYYIFDVNLILLLEELKLIEYNTFFDKVNRTIYAFGAVMLGIVSIILISYGAYVFMMLVFAEDHLGFLDDIFKSIIAITLGLAIYDQAKQIFEHEVLFRSLAHEEGKQFKMLSKFLSSIIIALSIESLMVVFKIALTDYTQMQSALYILLGTTIMFVGLGYFYKVIHKDEA
jgi:ABC-type uncharacterized transport system substrate-binding protein